MKNIYKINLILFVIIMINSKNIFGISDEFEFLINTVGVPKYNTNGKLISENVYNKYKVFSYDEPSNLLYYHKQRFKTLSNGKDSYNGNSGEFNILGYNYKGSVIYNFYFPVDFIPETTPDNWNYIPDDEALKSWEIDNFKTIESKEYMMHTSMLFDEIDFVNNKTNPYNQLNYNLTAYNIGLNKVVMNTPATFKTNGIFTVRRKNLNNQERYGIFSAKPMAINANIKSDIKCEDNIVLSSKDKSKKLNINFGANINGLNKYATVNNIKEIVSKLYINNELVASVSNSKVNNINKNYEFIIDRNIYNKESKYPLCIKVESYFYTEFEVDGIFKDKKEKTIYLEIEKENLENVRSKSLNILEKRDNKYILKPLITSIYKDDLNTLGIIEKGKYLAIDFESLEKINTSDVNIYINGKQIEFEEVINKDLQTVIKIYIEPNLQNTVISWNYLRNKTNNYFDIDTNLVGRRIIDPNILEIEIGDNKYIQYFDTIDYFEYNINFNNGNFKQEKGFVSLNE